MRKGLERARVVGMDPGNQSFGPHVEKGQLHALVQGAGAELAPPVVAVADDQHDFAVRPVPDQTHKAHGQVIAVVSHEEAAALIEEMGEYGQLNPVDELLYVTRDMARIAEVAHDVLVVQPVHQVQRIGSRDFRAQGYERLAHLQHRRLQE
ncbi:hypothetical protein SDC9_168239 [bioreactor metagenome]|uniref:Uncharacterized protein n=1 Tax=bioreactor metagenome TaxID=1076179 RepID=A0A645G4L8_9ZZZZ